METIRRFDISLSFERTKGGTSPRFFPPITCSFVYLREKTSVEENTPGDPLMEIRVRSSEKRGDRRSERALVRSAEIGARSSENGGERRS